MFRAVFRHDFRQLVVHVFLNTLCGIDGFLGFFANDFGFEETADQAAAIAATIEDLKRAKPMDRLVCGDVGFGKTEVALRAEEAGFSFATMSDHFHPWTDSQGHSPFAWSVLGAIAQATHDLVIGTGVTCPTTRLHPAIAAQAAATMARPAAAPPIWNSARRDSA